MQSTIGAALVPFLSTLISLLLEPWLDRTAYMLGNSAAFLLVLLGTWVITSNNVLADTWYRLQARFFDRSTVIVVSDPRYRNLVSRYVAENHPQCVSIWRKGAGPMVIGNINYDRDISIELDGKKVKIQVYIHNTGDGKEGDMCIQYPTYVSPDAILSFFNRYQPKDNSVQTYVACRTPTTNGKWGPVTFKSRQVPVRYASAPLPYSGAALTWFQSVRTFLADAELSEEVTSLLLEGEPGTGKTRFASLLAALSGVKIFYSSADLVCDADALMSMIASLHETVDPNEKYIFVIEEMDKIKDWDSVQHGILNTFLDGPLRHPGQVSIITCNDDQWVRRFPSLCRAGRMEQVRVGKLSNKCLCTLLAHYRPDWALPEVLGLDITIAELTAFLQKKEGCDLCSLSREYGHRE